MRIVLFLGAGFSAPFGCPVMNNFSEFVENSTKISADDKEFYNSLVLDARKANSFLESSPRNLEDILSFAVMGDRLGLLDNSFSRIVRIIRDVCVHVSDFDGYWNRYDVFRQSYCQ